MDGVLILINELQCLIRGQFGCPWDLDCAVEIENIAEWVDDLFLYNDEQRAWVLPRLMLVFVLNLKKLNDFSFELNQIINFINPFMGDIISEVSRGSSVPFHLFYEEMSQMFSKFNDSERLVIARWLEVIKMQKVLGVSDERLNSAIVFWQSFSRGQKANRERGQ